MECGRKPACAAPGGCLSVGPASPTQDAPVTLTNAGWAADSALAYDYGLVRAGRRWVGGGVVWGSNCVGGGWWVDRCALIGVSGWKAWSSCLRCRRNASPALPPPCPTQPPCHTPRPCRVTWSFASPLASFTFPASTLPAGDVEAFVCAKGAPGQGWRSVEGLGRGAVGVVPRLGRWVVCMGRCVSPGAACIAWEGAGAARCIQCNQPSWVHHPPPSPSTCPILFSLPTHPCRRCRRLRMLPAGVHPAGRSPRARQQRGGDGGGRRHHHCAGVRVPRGLVQCRPPAGNAGKLHRERQRGAGGAGGVREG